MRDDEERVAQSFIAWLVRTGWSARHGRSPDEADVVATRGTEEELHAVVAAPSGDVDAGYGRLLRHVVSAPNVRYAMVGPSGCIQTLGRVPAHVRESLGISIYEVNQDGSVSPVREQESAGLPKSTAGIAAWLGEATLVSVDGARQWHGAAAVHRAMEKVRDVRVGPRARAFFDELNAMQDRRKAVGDWPALSYRVWRTGGGR